MTPELILRAGLCREPWCAENASKSTRESAIEEVRFAKEYAEPGYTNPDKGILFANWNYMSREVTDLLERYGYEIEWSDEWATCDCCQRALRTSPDSYQWTRSYIQDDDTGEIICFDCLTVDDVEKLENNPSRAVTLPRGKLEEFGYRELQCGYESGWHPGMNADPKAIYTEFREHGHKRLLFQISEASQFYVTFCIWEKIEDIDE